MPLKCADHGEQPLYQSEGVSVDHYERNLMNFKMDINDKVRYSKLYIL